MAKRQRKRRKVAVAAKASAGAPPGGPPLGEGSPNPGPPDRSAYGHISDRLESLKARKFASGRRAAIEALDCMLGDDCNIQLLYKSLQNMFEDDPAAFMRDFVRLFVAPSMLEPSPPTESGADENERQIAERTLREVIALAFETHKPAVVVAARRELSLLQGLQQEPDKALTAESLRAELEAMQASIGGGGNGSDRHRGKGRLTGD